MFYTLRSSSLSYLGIFGIAGLLLFLQFTAALSPFMALGAVLFIFSAWLILRNPYFGFYAMTFFLPFERIGSYDVLCATVRISQVLFFLTLIGWLARGILEQRLTFQKNPLFFPLLLFFALNTLSLVNAENIHRSLLVLAFTVFTSSLALLIPQIMTRSDNILTATRVVFVSTAVVSVFWMYQFIGDFIGLPTEITGLRELYTKDILGFPRVQSTALEPLYFAHFLLLPLGFAYALFLSKSVHFRLRWLFFILIVGSLNLILTVSRGGYIAFFVMILGITVFSLRNVLSLKRIATFSIAVLVVGLLAIRFLNIDNAWEKFLTHTQNVFSGASFEERLATFEYARRAFISHPWIGVGVGGFGPFMSIHPYVVPKEGWKIVNNEFLELLSEVGLLGFFTFLIIVSILLLRSVKALRVNRDSFLRAMLVGSTCAFIAMLVQYQTFSVLYIMQVWFLIGLLVSIQNLALRSTKTA